MANSNPKFIFWSGNRRPASVTKKFHEKLKKVLDASGVGVDYGYSLLLQGRIPPWKLRGRCVGLERCRRCGSRRDRFGETSPGAILPR